MTTIEIFSRNYMEALLRAAILLGSLRRSAPVREITISAYRVRNDFRHLIPRCKIISQDIPVAPSQTPCAPDWIGVNYLILYPTCGQRPS